MDVDERGSALFVGEADTHGLDLGAGGGPRCAKARRGSGRPQTRQPDPGRGDPFARAAKHIVGGADIDRRPVGPQGEHEIRQGPGSVHAVLDQHDHRRPVGPQACQAREEGRGAGRIQIRGRFVQDQDRGPRREHSGQREPLLLPAGEPVGTPPFQPGQASLGDDLRDAGAHRVASPVPILQPECDVVLHSFQDQLRARVLEDDADLRCDRTSLGGARVQPGHGQLPSDFARDVARDQARESQAQRTLARARRPDHQQAAARGKIERDAVQRSSRGAAIPDLQVADPDRPVDQAGNPSRTPLRRSD